jgi:hypothetical protein
MFSDASIRRVGHEVERLHRAVQSTFAVRRKGPKEQEAYERACSEFYSFGHDLFKLWDPAVLLEIRQTSGVWRNTALLFLEVDPWFFRSGYLKEKLCHVLKQASLTPREKQRVQEILLYAVTTRFRREFRFYSRLACQVWDKPFLNRLHQLACAAEARTRVQARWMLEQITQYRKIHPEKRSSLARTQKNSEISK